jgi:hypothetical protein
MHVENLRIGTWVRIEGLKPYRFNLPDEAYLWSSQVETARRWLQQIGGMPLQVVACQFPFLLANAKGIGTVMLDLRFVTVGKCDQKFRDVVARIQAKAPSPVVLGNKQPGAQCSCGQCNNDDDDDQEWEAVDG